MSSQDSSESEMDSPKHSKSLVQPKSTPLPTKKKKRTEESDQPKKKLKKELLQLEKDQEESMFYSRSKEERKPTKRTPIKPSKKEETPSRRGNAFTDGEICYMLGLLYAGHDNSECTKKYLERYTSSSRTQQSVKTKFNWLRSDAVAKFSGVPIEKVESHEDALDFLKPSLVSKGDDFYVLFSKSQWQNAKVGFKGSQLRFHLTQERKNPTSDFSSATFDGLCSFIHIMEIESNLEFVGPFEDDHYKGAQLKLKPLNLSKVDDDWSMI
jgi:hypothetical protein